MSDQAQAQPEALVELVLGHENERGLAGAADVFVLVRLGIAPLFETVAMHPLAGAGAAAGADERAHGLAVEADAAGSHEHRVK